MMSRVHCWVVLCVVIGAAVVTSEALGADTYYVATDGSDSNDGSIGSPLATFTHAIDLSGPGDTIYARGGTYNLSSRITVSKSGASGSRINLLAYPGETPVLDFSSMSSALLGSSGGRGLQFGSDASWWNVKGLVIENAKDNGLYNGGNHNIFDQLELRYNADSGLQLDDTASNNLIVNCDSYENFDPQNGGENADGFAAKFESLGPGNIFRGDRAWGNSDDGWDTWASANGVLVQDSWSFDNGINIWGIAGFTGDGNGYKLGKPGGDHVLTNVLAVDNAANGIDVNGNGLGVQVYNSTSHSNSGKNWQFDEDLATHILTNNISIGGTVTIYPLVNDTHNTWNGITVSSADFESLSRVAGGVDLLRAPREADGSLPDLGSYLHLVPDSNLIDAGVPISFTFGDVTYNLPYNDLAPDLGAFETGSPVIPEPASAALLAIGAAVAAGAALRREPRQIAG
jgi:hypothetical protein